MVVIGLDPGSIRFGVGILKKEQGKISFLHAETISLKEDSFYAKMKTLLLRLQSIYERFPIQYAAIEEGFLGKNVATMNVLAKVRGATLASLILKDIPLKPYSPREVKLALTGNGNASKIQVSKMLKILLNIKEMTLNEDESDALAIAYCHLLS